MEALQTRTSTTITYRNCHRKATKSKPSHQTNKIFILYTNKVSHVRGLGKHCADLETKFKVDII